MGDSTGQIGTVDLPSSSHRPGARPLVSGKNSWPWNPVVGLEKTAIRRKKLLPVQAVVQSRQQSLQHGHSNRSLTTCAVGEEHEPGQSDSSHSMRSYERSRRFAVGKISHLCEGDHQRPVSACHKTTTVPPAHHSRAHCFTCAITPLLLLSRACAVLSTLRGLIPRGLASTPLITTCMAVLSTFVACPRPCTYAPHENVRFGIMV